jgi:hypothetical protein
MQTPGASSGGIAKPSNPDLNVGKLEYELAAAEVARQHARIAEIRTNAGLVIAAVSLVASFLGAKTIDLAHDVNRLSSFTLLLLPPTIFAASRAIWPPRDAKGRLGGWADKRRAGIQRLTGFGYVFGHGLPPGTVTQDSSYESLACALREIAGVNQKLINRRANMLMAAILLLLAQAILWAVALIFVHPQP